MFISTIKCEKETAVVVVLRNSTTTTRWIALNIFRAARSYVWKAIRFVQFVLNGESFSLCDSLYRRNENWMFYFYVKRHRARPYLPELGTALDINSFPFLPKLVLYFATSCIGDLSCLLFTWRLRAQQWIHHYGPHKYNFVLYSNARPCQMSFTFKAPS